MSSGAKDPLQHAIAMQTPPQPRPQSRSHIHKSINELTSRPPLEIHIKSEVIVVNGDRSNLSWKRYTLIDMNPRTGMCVVEGISDSRQRNFPRSVVKPLNWIEKLKNMFDIMAGNQTHHYLEYHNFLHAINLMGAKYDDSHALKIFKQLDIKANGLLTFRQWLNWIYGIGRATDKGRLLTTIECMVGLRKWRNNLAYNVMYVTSEYEYIWCSAMYDREACASNKMSVCLITAAAADNIGTMSVSRNLDSFSLQFRDRLAHFKESLVEVYSPSNEDIRECSVVVMGNAEIGKSALINKFVGGIFVHDYDPTIQDGSRKQILVDGEPALLDILDTAGQDEFASMRYDWLRDSVDILLICFSRTDHESFQRAEELINIAKRLLRQQMQPRIVPILLVATKKDLYESELQQVTFEDVVELKERYNANIADFIEYEECSAFMDDNVTEVFESAVRLYRKWRDGRSGIEIKYLSQREKEQARRQDRYVQNMALGTSTRNRTKCVSCLARFCPALAATMEGDEFIKNKKLNIACVPKDKFGDELAEPSYSKQHFFVQREVSGKRLVYCIFAAIFFPVLLSIQTLYFLFYCKCACTNCCFKCLREDADLTDPQIAWLYDFLASIVGRDPRETAKDSDGRKWFLSQTIGQKVTRCLLTIVIDILFFFALWNAITVGFGWFHSSNISDSNELSVLETLGPLQLWLAQWVILSIYMSIDIDVQPKPPSMQCLRPYVMYLNSDESIRTTAYVFLRGFSKSTLTMFRLEASMERICSAFIIAAVWIFVPGVVRVAVGADGGGKFFPQGLHREAIWSMATSFFLVLFLVLGLNMQLMSGLVKYIEWMNDITSMLDVATDRHNNNNNYYINLVRHNNTLAWLEMRSYLYTKGLIIFSRQEIFVIYVILLQCLTAMYILWRLMSGTGIDIDNTYGSPSFVGILLLFVVLTYSLLRILRTTRRIERLQHKQIALLAAQKFQIYYKRITWHPSKEEVEKEKEENELSEGNEAYDPDWADIDPRNLPRLKSVIDDNSDSDTATATDADDEFKAETTHLLISAADADADADIDNSHNTEVVFASPEISDANTNSEHPVTLSKHPTRLRLEKTIPTNYNDDISQNESMFSAEYLEQSEKFVQAVINICEAQDIIPRVFNIKIDIAVGLSILCTGFAVIPTAVKLLFGDECDDWS